MGAQLEPVTARVGDQNTEVLYPVLNDRPDREGGKPLFQIEAVRSNHATHYDGTRVAG